MSLLDDLARTTDADLVTLASGPEATLHQLHAIRELAVRATGRTPALLDDAVEQVVGHLGPAWRVHRGLPSGYLGAQVLFESPVGRGPLSVALALAPAEEREDLLRWLSPTGRVDTDAHAVRIERELLLDDVRPAEAVARALADAAGDPQVAVDVEPLPGEPGAAALIAVSAPGWRRLVRGPEPVSAALGTTVYWPAPEELGGLGPDLRVAVDPTGARHLVDAVPDGLGFRIDRRSA